MSTTAVPQPRPDWQNDWQQLLSYLPENYEQLAREHKMLEVQYGNAKIKTAQDLLRFVFVHVGCDLPLRQSVAVVGAAGGPKLSAMRLHKKMQRSPSYLEALIARMVRRCLAPGEPATCNTATQKLERGTASFAASLARLRSGISCPRSSCRFAYC